MNTTKNSKLAFYFLLPSIVLMSIFIFYPIVKTILISFQEPSGNFGLGNYTYTYGLDSFKIAIYNTSIYTIFVIFFEMLLALVIAYALSQKIKFRNTFQTIFFLPYVTSVIAVGTVFKIMYNSDWGIINQTLQVFGIQPVMWLTQNPLLSMIILGIWKGLAFNILILYTALATNDKNLEKAAILDGFSPMQIYLKIKLPQIKGVLIYLITINIIFNIKVYEEVIALFGTTTPGSGGKANTLVYMISKMVLEDVQVAAVLAVTLLVLIVSIRIVISFLTKKGG